VKLAAKSVQTAPMGIFVSNAASAVIAPIPMGSARPADCAVIVSRSALAVKDASNVPIFARNAAKNALNAMMNSVRPVTFAANVQEMTHGARTVCSAVTVPKFARIAVRFVWTAPIRYVKSAASAPVVLTRYAPNAAFV